MEFALKLKQTYDVNKPIFLTDIKVENMSNDNVRQYLSRLVKNGEIKRYDNGIYYFPKKTILGDLPLSFNDVIYYKYINNNGKVIGYYSGLTFQNSLGLTTQVPSTIEITTNIEKSIKRDIKIKERKLILRKGRIIINEENYKILQYLDLFINLDLYQIKENYLILREYILSNNFSKIELQEILPKYSIRVMKLLIESGLIYEFTSK